MQDGFLSPQIEDWRLEVCSSMREWVGLVGRVNSKALELMRGMSPHGESHREMYSAALYARAVQSFEASVILAERGMLADAETLSRSVVETSLYLGGLALIPNFHLQMAADNNDHYLQMAKGISKALETSPDAGEQLTATDLARLATEVKALNFEFRSIKMRALAQATGMEKLYEVVYRQLSGESAHPTITSLEKHFRRTNGTVEKLTFSPQRDGVEQALSMSITAVLFSMEAVCKIFDLGKDAADLDALTSAHVRLRDQLAQQLRVPTPVPQS